MLNYAQPNLSLSEKNALFENYNQGLIWFLNENYSKINKLLKMYDFF